MGGLGLAHARPALQQIRAPRADDDIGRNEIDDAVRPGRKIRKHASAITKSAIAAPKMTFS